MFTVSETAIDGVKEIFPLKRDDERGYFVKTYHADFFAAHGMATDYKEQYFSVSRKGVLRGLHFQLPPDDHEKLVTCIEGDITDAVLDLRAGSATYRKFQLFRLCGEKASQLYIPRGIAHGFYVHSASACVHYNVTAVFSAKNDAGIFWNSAGIPWPDTQPIVSDKDRSLPPLSAFANPFT